MLMIVSIHSRHDLPRRCDDGRRTVRHEQEDDALRRRNTDPSSSPRHRSRFVQITSAILQNAYYFSRQEFPLPSIQRWLGPVGLLVCIFYASCRHSCTLTSWPVAAGRLVSSPSDIWMIDWCFVRHQRVSARTMYCCNTPKCKRFSLTIAYDS